jgi:hypothetical protein
MIVKLKVGISFIGRWNVAVRRCHDIIEFLAVELVLGWMNAYFMNNIKWACMIGRIMEGIDKYKIYLLANASKCLYVIFGSKYI